MNVITLKKRDDLLLKKKQFVRNRPLLKTQPHFLREDDPNRLQTFFSSLVNDQGHLQVPVVWDVALTQKSMNAMYITASILAVGAIATVIAAKRL